MLDLEILEQAEIEKLLRMLSEKVKDFHIRLNCNCWISEINSLYVTENCLIAYLHQFAIG